MCKAKNKMVRQKFIQASGKGYMELCQFQDVFGYVNKGVMRDEIHRALHTRMEEEHLIAHYFLNTDHNLWA